MATRKHKDEGQPDAPSIDAVEAPTPSTEPASLYDPQPQERPYHEAISDEHREALGPDAPRAPQG